jgi:hypothetical protein
VNVRPHSVAVLFATAVVAVMSIAATPTKPAARPAAPDTLSPSRLPEPEYLPDIARSLLHERMRRHGQDATGLMLSVVLLKYDDVQETAKRIAGEPRLVRPTMGNDNELNRYLPERFFVLQDQLRDTAQKLAESAGHKDDKALAKSFGQLTETCVACHNAYLRP